MEHEQTVVTKEEWCLFYLNDLYLSFGVRLLAGVITQCIFTSSAFAYMYWFRLGGSMPGLCRGIDKIYRDGQMHSGFACLLFNKLSLKPPVALVKEMIMKAVTLEKEFFNGT